MNDDLAQQLLRGMARLQARQEMLECIVRALITETPPAHPLWWKALHTAKSDLNRRLEEARPPELQPPPEIDADALALWNVLVRACAAAEGGPPETDGARG